MNEKFVRLVETTLDRPAGSVRMEDEFRKYAEWDSMAYMALVAMIDQEFGVLISPEEIRKLQTLTDLLAHVEAHKGA